MTLKISPIPVAVTLAAFSLWMTPLHAADRFWTNQSGGLFQNATNWQGSQPPGTNVNDWVHFNTGATDEYEVTFNADVSLGSVNPARFQVYGGDRVVFNLSGTPDDYQVSVFDFSVFEGSATVEGGEVTSSGVMYLGSGGKTGRLTLRDGAVFTGTNTGSDFYRVGSGTGSQGSLFLEGGSQYTLTRRSLFVGVNASNNLVTLKGASEMTIGGGLRLGESDTNASTNTSSHGNRVEVLEGSVVSVTSVLHLGYASDALGTNNTLLISGANSKVIAGDAVRIGRGSGGTSTGNSVTIANGGALEMTNAAAYPFLVIGAGSGNRLRVESGGAFTHQDTTVNNVIRGAIEVEGGSFKAGRLELRGASVLFTQGTLELSNRLSVEGNSQFTFRLDEAVTLKVGTTVAFADATAINISAVDASIVSGQRYTLFAATTSITGASHLSLNLLPDGYIGTLDWDSNHVYLTVESIPEPSVAFLALLGVALLGWRRRFTV